MNKFKGSILLFIPILAISLAVLWKTNCSGKKEDVHYHAGFIVYVDGKKQDFSDVKYMNVSPCAAPGQEIEEDEQLEKAHLHDGVGDVVHAHRTGVTWQDLFTNIKYDISGEIAGYVNGEKVENILSKQIVPYESVLIVAGDDSGVDVKEIITREHIVEVEGQSEACAS